MSDEIEVEGMKIKGATIKKLLSDSFVKQLENSGVNLEAVSLVLVREEDSPEGAKKLTSVVIGHQNAQEIKEKLVHLNCPDGELILKVSKIIIDSNKE